MNEKEKTREKIIKILLDYLKKEDCYPFDLQVMLNEIKQELKYELKK